MRAQKQAFRHRPEEGVYGDCFRTAIACLLDIDRDSIPHDHVQSAEWCKVEDGGQSRHMNEWLAERGLFLLHIPYQGELPLDELLKVAASMAPGVNHLLGGRSATPADHVVIACDGKLVWDPSLDESGIVGPQSDGLWWLMFLARRG